MKKELIAVIPIYLSCEGGETKHCIYPSRKSPLEAMSKYFPPYKHYQTNIKRIPTNKLHKEGFALLILSNIKFPGSCEYKMYWGYLCRSYDKTKGFDICQIGLKSTLELIEANKELIEHIFTTGNYTYLQVIQ